MSENVMRDLIRAANRARTWTSERNRLIVEARDAGETWPDIATATGLSRMGAIQAYKRTLEQQQTAEAVSASG